MPAQILAPWTSPPDEILLAPNEIHIWLADLDLPAATTHALCEVLNRDERRRASRAKDPVDRDRWIVNRAALRILLGQYLKEDSKEIEFSYGAHGKPGLADPTSLPLEFNAAKSAGTAIFAISLNRDVGVDLERVEYGFDGMKLAARVFTPAEVNRLRALPVRHRQWAFLRYWTMKEAYLKARGLGSHARVNRFQLAFAARNEVRVLSHDEANAPRGWSVIPVDVSSGYVGAVAMKGPLALIRNWQWSPPPGLTGSTEPAQPMITRGVRLPRLHLAAAAFR